MPRIREAIEAIGVRLIFIPGGLTGYLQPIDVGIVSPFKHWVREHWSIQDVGLRETLAEKRTRIAAIINDAWNQISPETIENSFIQITSTCPNSELEAELVELSDMWPLLVK
jgi:hypothetical protein